uniref:leucine efflux protein LeuE n=1 Tax=Castellaniella defragrans TaxID=75697 RepID=UPI0033408216
MLSEYGVLNLWTYVAGTVFIIVLPGPNSLFVLATSASHGVRVGYQAALGIFVGDTILMVLAAAGAASVLRVLPMLFMALKVLGAVYLCYLGLRLLASAWHPATPERARPVEVGTGGRFRKALFLSLLNPKAILFLLSFFVQFVDPSYPHPALPFLILGAILQCLSFLYLSLLIFGGARLADAFRRRPGVARLGCAATGSLFLWFAGRLAFEA